MVKERDDQQILGDIDAPTLVFCGDAICSEKRRKLLGNIKHQDNKSDVAYQYQNDDDSDVLWDEDDYNDGWVERVFKCIFSIKKQIKK